MNTLGLQDGSINWCFLFVVLLTLILTAPGADALENSDLLLQESEFFSDIPAIDTVTRLPQPRSKTPAAVTVIDREMIDASGIRRLPDLFRLVPGFQVAYPNGTPAVTYHGLSDVYSRRILLLIDGRLGYGAFIGSISWKNMGISVEDIDRIEVVRGPNAATYGANAFLATINIVTRHAVQSQGTTLVLRTGNHESGDGVLRYGTKFDGGALRITAEYAAEDGLDGLPDDIWTKVFNLRSDLQPSVQDSVMIQLVKANQNAIQGSYNNPFFPPDEVNVTSRLEQIRWQRQLRTNQSLSLQFYHRYSSLDFDYLVGPIPIPPPVGASWIPFSNDIFDERYDLEIEHRFQPTDTLRMVWGIGVRRDRAESEPLLNTCEQVGNDSSRLFVNAEWQGSEMTTLNTGLMLEHTDLTGTDASPRLAINHQLSSNHTLRASWSKAN
jgi:iron complex outermembrane recepter protein